MSCSTLRVSERFGWTYRLHLQDWSICEARNRHEVGSKQKALCYFLSWLRLRPWRSSRNGTPKRRLTLNGLAVSSGSSADVNLCSPRFGHVSMEPSWHHSATIDRCIASCSWCGLWRHVDLPTVFPLSSGIVYLLKSMMKFLAYSCVFANHKMLIMLLSYLSLRGYFI
jgi:hypothetical protein